MKLSYWLGVLACSLACLGCKHNSPHQENAEVRPSADGKAVFAVSDRKERIVLERHGGQLAGPGYSVIVEDVGTGARIRGGTVYSFEDEWPYSVAEVIAEGADVPPSVRQRWCLVILFAKIGAFDSGGSIHIRTSGEAGESEFVLRPEPVDWDDSADHWQRALGRINSARIVRFRTAGWDPRSWRRKILWGDE
jgi:hypothetical protein